MIEQTSLADIIQRNTNVRGLQDNVFFMQASVSGRVAQPSPGGQRLQPVAGATVELLDGEGELVDSTVTDLLGRYRFDNIAETGDYQVRLVGAAPDGRQEEQIVDLLISRGQTDLRGVDLALAGPQNGGRPAEPHRPPRRALPPRDQVAAVDEAFAEDPMQSALAQLAELDGRPLRRRR